MNHNQLTLDLIILGDLSEKGRRPAEDFKANAIGKLGAKGWVNIVNGWADITDLGRAIYASRAPL